MKVSVIIPYYINYNSSLVERIYSVIADCNSEFEVILVSSSKMKGIYDSNVRLTNTRPHLKCYSISSRKKHKLVQHGIFRCNYDIAVIIDLDKFQEYEIDELRRVFTLKDFFLDMYISFTGGVLIGDSRLLGRVIHFACVYNIICIATIFESIGGTIYVFDSLRQTSVSSLSCMLGYKYKKRVNQKKLQEEFCDYMKRKVE